MSKAARVMTLAFSIALVLVLVLFGAWFARACDEPLPDLQALNDIEGDVLERQEARDRVPPEQNGYEVLAGYLTASDAESRPFRALRKERACIPEGKFTLIERRTMEVQQFAPALPILERVLKLPHFHYVVRTPAGHRGELEALMLLRDISLVLSRSERDATMRNDYEAALRYLEIKADLGYRCLDSGPLSMHRFATSVLSQTMQTVCWHIEKGHLSAAGRERWRKWLESHPLPEECIGHAADEEYVAIMQLLEGYQAGTMSDAETSRVVIGTRSRHLGESGREFWGQMVRLRAYQDAEVRRIQNEYLARRSRIYALDPGGMFCYENPYSIIATHLMPDTRRVIEQFRYLQNWREALKMQIALHDHHSAHGRWPENLEVPPDRLGTGWKYRIVGSDYSLRSDGPRYALLKVDLPEDGISVHPMHPHLTIMGDCPPVKP